MSDKLFLLIDFYGLLLIDFFTDFVIFAIFLKNYYIFNYLNEYLQLSL